MAGGSHSPVREYTQESLAQRKTAELIWSLFISNSEEFKAGREKLKSSFGTRTSGVRGCRDPAMPARELKEMGNTINLPCRPWLWAE